MIFWVLLWFLVLAALIWIEAITADLVTVWFMPAAVVCIVLAALKIDYVIQIIVFFAVSAVLVVLYKTVLKKFIVGKKKEKTNVDLFVGEIGVVQEDVDNLSATGLVKVKSQIWTARSFDDAISFKAGERVTIVGVEGVKLICKKADE